ncbi:MAG: DUF1570 domain-containing protein [Planctomycetota bacterium]
MRKPSPREVRLLIYVFVLGGVVAWKVSREWWAPDMVISTAHYRIQSAATREETDKTGRALESLYMAYAEFLDDAGLSPNSHDRLQVKLFKDREEFRRVNDVRGWAEAFYHEPFCYAYNAAGKPNPYHWMLHEATHQLNSEVAGVDPEKWLEEGLATYFSTRRIGREDLIMGETDTNTYPVWWLHKLATSGELGTDKANGSVIPLRFIVSGSGGPDIDDAFNLYYLHWWTLTHFLLHHEDGRYRGGVAKLLQNGSGVDAFEEHVGDIERIEQRWYEHVRVLKKLQKQTTPPVELH